MSIGTLDGETLREESHSETEGALHYRLGPAALDLETIYRTPASSHCCGAADTSRTGPNKTETCRWPVLMSLVSFVGQPAGGHTDTGRNTS